MKGPKKILIVEDDPSIYMTLYDRFSREGFSVISARNGEEGLTMAIGDQPDLILLDIIMPVMDGVTMLKKLCQNERCKNLPVIVLTNLSDEKQIAECMENNVYNYLVKTDWSLDSVVKKVKERLGV